jgi:hypothetical protein
MFDLRSEQVVTLATAAALIPPARGGKKTHVSTLLRWILAGGKAPDGSTVYLEAQRLPRGWLTTREALARFLAALTPRPGSASPAPAPRTPARRRRASERAAAALSRVGI